MKYKIEILDRLLEIVFLSLFYHALIVRNFLVPSAVLKLYTGFIKTSILYWINFEFLGLLQMEGLASIISFDNPLKDLWSVSFDPWLIDHRDDDVELGWIRRYF